MTGSICNGQPQHSQQYREAFFDWLEDVATHNAMFNRNLSQEEVFRQIEQAREGVVEWTETQRYSW